MQSFYLSLYFIFVFIDDNVFSFSHNSMEIENLEHLNKFTLNASSNLNDNVDDKIYSVFISAKLNFCDSELNICKLIRVCYELPIQLTIEQNDGIIWVDLPLNLTNF